MEGCLQDLITPAETRVEDPLSQGDFFPNSHGISMLYTILLLLVSKCKIIGGVGYTQFRCLKFKILKTIVYYLN